MHLAPLQQQWKLGVASHELHCSTTKVNKSAVNGGITNEVCKVANIDWGYKDTL